MLLGSWKHYACCFQLADARCPNCIWLAVILLTSSFAALKRSASSRVDMLSTLAAPKTDSKPMLVSSSDTWRRVTGSFVGLCPHGTPQDRVAEGLKQEFPSRLAAPLWHNLPCPLV